MYQKTCLSKFLKPANRRFLAVACAMLLMPGEVALQVQGTPAQAQPQAAAEQAAPKIPPEQRWREQSICRRQQRIQPCRERRRRQDRQS